MAAAATVRVESGSQSNTRLIGRISAHRIGLKESAEAIGKKTDLFRGECGKRLANAITGSAHARILHSLAASTTRPALATALIASPR